VHFKIYTTFQFPNFSCDVQETETHGGWDWKRNGSWNTSTGTTSQEVSKFIILTNTRSRRYLRYPPYTRWDNDITRSVRRPESEAALRRESVYREERTWLCAPTQGHGNCWRRKIYVSMQRFSQRIKYHIKNYLSKQTSFLWTKTV